jgi:vacuolar-type H+-ATPase subunit I/STV1
MKIKHSLIATYMIFAAGIGCKPSYSDNESIIASETNAWAANTWQGINESTTNALVKIEGSDTNAWASVKEDLARSAVDYSYEQKADFVAAVVSDLEALDKKIQKLSDKVATARDNLKADAKAKLEALREQRKKLNEKLEDAKNSADSNWLEAKANFKTAYDDVKNAVKDTWKWLTDKLSE